MRQTYDGFKKQKRIFFDLLVLCVDHSSVIVKGRATTATEFSQTAQQDGNRIARILRDRKFNLQCDFSNLGHPSKLRCSFKRSLFLSIFVRQHGKGGGCRVNERFLKHAQDSIQLD